MKITQMSQANAQLIHRAINQALAKVGEEFGITVRCRTTRYDGNGMTGSFDVKLLATDASGEGSSQCTRLAQMQATNHGYVVDRPNARGWKIVDYNSRAHKMPWIVQAPGGKRYKISDASAAGYFTPSPHEKEEAARKASVERMVNDIPKNTGDQAPARNYGGQF